MADSSALRCLSPFPAALGAAASSSSATRSPRYVPFPLRSPLHHPQFARSVRPCASGSDNSSAGGFGGWEDDGMGFYPWDPRASSQDGAGIQWVPEDRITLFTSDGLIQLGGSLVPRRVPSDKQQGRSKVSQRFQKFQESDYMDPNQGLCLGALFNIAATNGLDSGRRLCIYGFCRSIEMLSDVVEDTVIEHGGEVVAAEKASKGGLLEKLNMIVAVPLLWGVPPASETLHVAVRSGGGIIEKVYWQWDFL